MSDETTEPGAQQAEEQGGDPRNVEMPEVTEDTTSRSNRQANLDAILDVQVTLTLEIGRTSIPIKDLLSLSQGAVVELDRLVGQPHDVLVNGTLIAQGEVVVVDDKFGIRFTDIVSPSERVQKLQ
jgi:flagellar motor switch protein FliN